MRFDFIAPAGFGGGVGWSQFIVHWLLKADYAAGIPESDLKFPAFPADERCDRWRGAGALAIR